MSDFAPFPETRWTAIRALQSDDAESRKLAWDTVSRLYWHPVRSYIRAKWKNDEHGANDATQSFFEHVFEQDTLAKYDAERARFRGFLKMCLDRFLINEYKAQQAQKRGGGRTETLEQAGPDGSPLDPADPDSLDALFDQEWRRSLFEAAVQDVDQLATTDLTRLQFRVFLRYDIERGSADSLTYNDLAREFGLTVTTVTNYLHATRTKVRLALLERLRSITATETEYLEEARALFGDRLRSL